MIKREGRYILTIEDWNTVIKYFLLAPSHLLIFGRGKKHFSRTTFSLPFLLDTKKAYLTSNL